LWSYVVEGAMWHWPVPLAFVRVSKIGTLGLVAIIPVVCVSLLVEQQQQLSARDAAAAQR